MKTLRSIVFSIPLVVVVAACAGANGDAEQTRLPTTASSGARPVVAPSSSGGSTRPREGFGPFVRDTPPHHARHGVDACAYDDAGGIGSECIDALVQEPDAIRVRYMRRLSDAHTRLVAATATATATATTTTTTTTTTTPPRDVVAELDPEIAECCNLAGPCGTQKRTGHADCPKMDDGYACLAAAELLMRKSRSGAAAKGLHERACRCDAPRAQIPIPAGGRLACDGADKPVDRAANLKTSLSEEEARVIVACGTCDKTTGPVACGAEVEQLSRTDPELAGYISKIHATRCEVP